MNVYNICNKFHKYAQCNKNIIMSLTAITLKLKYNSSS